VPVVDDFDLVLGKSIFVILQDPCGAAGKKADQCGCRHRYASETFHEIIILQIYLNFGFSQNFSHNLCRPAANGAGLLIMLLQKNV
jgi:hypothetical protein